MWVVKVEFVYVKSLFFIYLSLLVHLVGYSMLSWHWSLWLWPVWQLLLLLKQPGSAWHSDLTHKHTNARWCSTFNTRSLDHVCLWTQYIKVTSSPEFACVIDVRLNIEIFATIKPLLLLIVFSFLSLQFKFWSFRYQEHMCNDYIQ